MKTRRIGQRLTISERRPHRWEMLKSAPSDTTVLVVAVPGPASTRAVETPTLNETRPAAAFDG
jgi:hypothetical protein